MELGFALFALFPRALCPPLRTSLLIALQGCLGSPLLTFRLQGEPLPHLRHFLLFLLLGCCLSLSLLFELLLQGTFLGSLLGSHCGGEGTL